MAKHFAGLGDKELAVMMAEGGTGAKDAFRELYNRYSSQVHAYCLKVMSNEEIAEDIFQETFIKFYQNFKVDHERLNIPGFLIKIARNLCLNQKRDKRTTVPIDEYDFVEFDTQNYEKKELIDLIDRSLELLEDEYREAFVLREYSGLPYEEIANVVGISLANAKSRVFRAKQKIKTILQPYLKDLSNY